MTMRHVWMENEVTQQAFANRAAQHFAEHPNHWTYSEDECETGIAPGVLMALRWGGDNDCVLVVKLDIEHVPTNYQQLIRRFRGE